jgi:hypothetical protein
MLSKTLPMLRRWAPQRQEPPTPAEQAEAQMYAARLAYRLDQALRQRRAAYARRLADLAAEFFPDHPRLIELRARQLLTAGDADAALRTLQLAPRDSGALRMLELLCQVHAGRKVAAHLELHAWSRKGSCPLDARRLLAVLEQEIGNFDSAAAALEHNLAQIEDPASLRMLIAIALLQGDESQARALAARLRLRGEAGVPGGELEAWLSWIGLPPAELTDEPDPASVDGLALELLGAEGLLPSLTAAYTRDAASPWSRLFARALERALPDLDDQLQAITCLAQLWLGLDDKAAARRWANRGLQLSPFSAPLAKVLARVSQAPESPAVGEAKSHIVEVVTRVADAYPDWPDVQALKKELAPHAA